MEEDPQPAPLFRPLSDQQRISLFRMHVAFGPGDVDIAADDDSRAARVSVGDVVFHLA